VTPNTKIGNITVLRRNTDDGFGDGHHPHYDYHCAECDGEYTTEARRLRIWAAYLAGKPDAHIACPACQRFYKSSVDAKRKARERSLQGAQTRAQSTGSTRAFKCLRCCDLNRDCRACGRIAVPEKPVRAVAAMGSPAGSCLLGVGA
jgi:hypothetical protein